MLDPKQTAYQPISLGSTCEAKFQICRKLYSAYYGKKSEAGFRMQMMPPERGERYYGWHAFDWQRTPFSALLTHLERDFDGILERQDLYIDGEFIMHRTTGTEHSHQFPGYASGWAEANIDSVYPLVRRYQEKRAVGWREMRKTPGPFLYVWTAATSYPESDHLPPPDQVGRLLELLSAGSPDHRFHLLMVANPGKDQDYSALGDRVSKAYRVEEVGKTLNMKWEGNDAAWTEILAPFTLTMHDRETPATPAAETPPPVTPPARRGLISRLFSR